MRNILLFSLLILLFSCHLEAQSKGVKHYLSMNSSVFVPYKPIDSYKLGLQSFSYSTGLEHRFKLNNKLNFSLQYSLTYFNFNLLNLEKKLSQTKIRDFSTGLGTQIGYQLNDATRMTAGMTIHKPIFTSVLSDIKAENKNNQLTTKYNHFEFQNINSWNPYFTIGFEKQFNLFNRNMTYSLQYNFGFSPYRNQYFIEQQSTLPKVYMQGITLGFKYKL